MHIPSFFVLLGLTQTILVAADSSAWECEICEDAVDLGLAALKNNSNAAVVSEQVTSACSKVASNATSECEKIAGTILAKGLELIEDNVQPSAVCSYLGYC
ncbi:hypothetical protein ZTR_06630 [Talaromyces verruculosus]|nr:hypothetical protein ZTR_06630 [Talaromyces verruculosus]